MTCEGTTFHQWEATVEVLWLWEIIPTHVPVTLIKLSRAHPQKGMEIGRGLVRKKGLSEKKIGEGSGGEFDQNAACTYMKLPQKK